MSAEQRGGTGGPQFASAAPSSSLQLLIKSYKSNWTMCSKKFAYALAHHIRWRASGEVRLVNGNGVPVKFWIMKKRVCINYRRE